MSGRAITYEEMLANNILANLIFIEVSSQTRPIDDVAVTLDDARLCTLKELRHLAEYVRNREREKA